MTIAPQSPAEVAPADLVTVSVDGIEVRVPKGMLVIRVAELMGIEIPRFCDHPLLDPVAACRACLIEIDGMPLYSVVLRDITARAERDALRERVVKSEAKNAAKEDWIRAWARYCNSGKYDPTIRDRFAKDIEARFLGGEFDSLKWLDTRDARMKREGAAEWLENEISKADCEYYERSIEGMREDAARLREGGE